MVGVVVDDEHLLAGGGQDGGGHGDVVEQAEAHGRGRPGVVAGRPHGAEGGGRLAGPQAVDGLEPGTGGQPGGVPRGRHGRGVGVESNT